MSAAAQIDIQDAPDASDANDDSGWHTAWIYSNWIYGNGAGAGSAER